MIPPRPFPPWWHASYLQLPSWTHPGEALAYGDLALLRQKWKARRERMAAGRRAQRAAIAVIVIPPWALIVFTIWRACS